jgi:hypothetical protein
MQNPRTRQTSEKYASRPATTVISSKIKVDQAISRLLWPASHTFLILPPQVPARLTMVSPEDFRTRAPDKPCFAPPLPSE